MLSHMFVIGIKCVLSSRSHALKSLYLLSASMAPSVIVFGKIRCLEGTDPVLEDINFKGVSKGVKGVTVGHTGGLGLEDALAGFEVEH